MTADLEQEHQQEISSGANMDTAIVKDEEYFYDKEHRSNTPPVPPKKARMPSAAT